MSGLTVGYIAGIIAAVVYAAQLVIPNIVALLLVGVVKGEHSAVTWSVLGRALSSTYWPLFYATDSAPSSPGVELPVKLVIWLRATCLAMVTVAAIVTPMGLYDVTSAVDQTRLVPFTYIDDISPMGYGTVPRSALGFSRVCGGRWLIACPASDAATIARRDNTSQVPDLARGYDTRLPRSLSGMFQSGLVDHDRTVSSIFDIEWRSYTMSQNSRVNNGSPYLVSSYRQLTTLIAEGSITAIEGLIVDNSHGGLGFRNHSIPSLSQLGAQWSEDLLFVEPETICVNTNLTIDFTIGSESHADSVQDLVLTDRGGFANLSKNVPEYNRSSPQTNADLFGRAYEAAWLNNLLTMMYFNVTNSRDLTLGPSGYIDSSIGRQFKLPITLPSVSYETLVSTKHCGDYLQLGRDAGSLNSSNTPSVTYANPFNISTNNFAQITTSCQGVDTTGLANISNIGVRCGMMYGAAHLQSGKSSLFFGPGTSGSIPLYSCASAAKASIKEVHFRSNGTHSLKSLKVEGITEKTYREGDSKPLWGVENTDQQLSDTRALWGLVASQYQNRSDLNTIRSAHLYLPGFADNFSTVPRRGYQNLPGVTFHTDALGPAYSLSSSTAWSGTQDYSGKVDLGLYIKWQALSADPSTAGKIIDLIWTDVAANAVLGARGSIPSSFSENPQKRESNSFNSQQQNSAQVRVTVYEQRVHYHRLFAIPAFVALFLTICVALGAFVSAIIGNARPARIQHYLTHLSSGRILSTLLYPDECEPLADSSTWVSKVGTKRIAMPRNGIPLPADTVSFPPRPSTRKGDEDTLFQSPGKDARHYEQILMRPVSSLSRRSSRRSSFSEILLIHGSSQASTSTRFAGEVPSGGERSERSQIFATTSTSSRPELSPM